MAWPPVGLQLLLMEDTHVRLRHVGGEKLAHAVAHRWYWPNLLADCKAFVSRCFECQLAGGCTHGSWMGKLLPLPAGPRMVWALDRIVDLGVPGGTRWQLLVAICCFSKFCVLMLLRDGQAATTARSF